MLWSSIYGTDVTFNNLYLFYINACKYMYVEHLPNFPITAICSRISICVFIESKEKD